jgi:hypothetical protein
MDGMGCAPAVDRPSSGLGNEENRFAILTASRDRKPMRQPQNMAFERFRHLT